MYPSHVNRKAIMGKIFSHYKVKDNVLDYIMPPKVAIIQQEVIVGVSKALEENKLSNSKVWLATKHAFLTIVVSAHNKSSMYTIWDCKTFGIHLLNISNATMHHRVIDEFGGVL